MAKPYQQTEKYKVNFSKAGKLTGTKYSNKESNNTKKKIPASYSVFAIPRHFSFEHSHFNSSPICTSRKKLKHFCISKTRFKCI